MKGGSSNNNKKQQKERMKPWFRPYEKSAKLDFFDNKNPL